MKYKLTDLAQIYYGPHEKGQISGAVKYLVSSHFDHFFQPSLFKESFVKDSNGRERYLLQPNDVIITGKGQRIFAWAYKPEFGKVIPSSLFYIIKINEPDKVIGEYLASFLNSEKINYKLKSLSAGTSIPSIQKNELGQLNVIIPSMEEQKRIVNLSILLDKDVALAAKLLEKKEALKKGLLNRVINNKIQNY